jgi:hypothetical protein
MKCTICKTGETHLGITTVTLQRDKSVVVIVMSPPKSEMTAANIT